MTDKTFFIHAGGTKTGTSALQNFFEINASRLERFDFAYEHRSNINSEYEINSGNGVLLYQTLSSFTSITDNEIDSLVLSYFGGCNNAICSSECFSSFEAHNWKRLVESTGRIGAKLKVIFYFRNIIPFLVSAYDQVIKQEGEWKLFDEWAEQESCHHAIAPKALRIIVNEIPKENIHVLHYDRVKADLIKSFLYILGIDPSFEVDPNEQSRQVNRSLTGEEREALIAVNKVLGKVYSTELSNLFIYAKPNLRGEPVSYHQTTIEFLLDHFSNEVDWVNKTFFNDQDIVSVLPFESVKETQSEKPAIQSARNGNAEKQVLNWALEKLKTIQYETKQRLLHILRNAAQNTSGISHPDIPDDYDPIAYLLLNPDLFHAGVEPFHHFSNHGRNEGRRYKF